MFPKALYILDNEYKVGTIIENNEEEENYLIRDLKTNFYHSIEYSKIIEVANSNQNLKSVIIEKYKNFCFRRVSKVVRAIKSKNKKKLFMTKNGQIYCAEKTENEEDTVLKEYDKYNKFHGFTVNFSLREEGDLYVGKNLYFSSNTECDINEYGILVPLPYYKRGIPPEEHQLICGVLSETQSEKCPPYIKWFKCSEQFYKTLTTIRNKNHPSNSRFSISQLFGKIQTNCLKLELEKISENYKKEVDICSIPELSFKIINERTESFCKISHFYQFLLRDCVFPDIELNWKSIKNSTYYEQHRRLYLFVKNKLLWMNEEIEEDEADEDYEFPVSL